MSVAAGTVAAAMLLAGCGSHATKSTTGTGPSSSDSATSSDSTPATDSATDSVTGSGTGTATDGSTDVVTDPASSDSGFPSFVTTPPPTTSRPVPSKPPVGLAPCNASSLRVVTRTVGAATTHAGYVISFSNTGQIACGMTGYPGVAILNSSGKPVVQAARTPSGYIGGVRNGKPPFPTAVLGAGQTASALLEGLDVNTATNRGCPAQSALLITPPNTTVPVRVAASTRICSQVQIHPVVTGTTGNQG